MLDRSCVVADLLDAALRGGWTLQRSSHAARSTYLKLRHPRRPSVCVRVSDHRYFELPPPRLWCVNLHRPGTLRAVCDRLHRRRCVTHSHLTNCVGPSDLRVRVCVRVHACSSAIDARCASEPNRPTASHRPARRVEPSAAGFTRDELPLPPRTDAVDAWRVDLAHGPSSCQRSDVPRATLLTLPLLTVR